MDLEILIYRYKEAGSSKPARWQQLLYDRNDHVDLIVRQVTILSSCIVHVLHLLHSISYKKI